MKNYENDESNDVLMNNDMNNATKKTLVLIISIGLFGMSELSFGQEKASGNELLEGKWTLETATIQKVTDGDTLLVEVNTMKNDLAFALFESLIFQADTLTVPLSDTYSSQGEYRLTDRKITFHFLPVPIELDYEIKNEKIHIMQQVAFGCKDCIYLVKTVYSHENN